MSDTPIMMGNTKQQVITGVVKVKIAKHSLFQTERLPRLSSDDEYIMDKVLGSLRLSYSDRTPGGGEPIKDKYLVARLDWGLYGAGNRFVIKRADLGDPHYLNIAIKDLRELVNPTKIEFDNIEIRHEDRRVFAFESK